MSCILPERDEDIAIGYFGESNSGKIKRLYREGLSHRYGRPMQMIAGIHYNYSPPPALFDLEAAGFGGGDLYRRYVCGEKRVGTEAVGR